MAPLTFFSTYSLNCFLKRSALNLSACMRQSWREICSSFFSKNILILSADWMEGNKGIPACPKYPPLPCHGLTEKRLLSELLYKLVPSTYIIEKIACMWTWKIKNLIFSSFYENVRGNARYHVVISWQSGMGTRDSGTKSRKPEAESREPESESRELKADSRKPKASSRQPKASTVPLTHCLKT